MRRTRVLPFVHIASGMPLDIVLAGSGLEDEFLARARLLDIETEQDPPTWPKPARPRSADPERPDPRA